MQLSGHGGLEGCPESDILEVPVHLNRALEVLIDHSGVPDGDLEVPNDAPEAPNGLLEVPNCLPEGQIGHFESAKLLALELLAKCYLQGGRLTSKSCLSVFPESQVGHFESAKLFSESGCQS